MNKREKKSSREFGLELAAIGGKYLLNLEHLHYGYWTGDLEVKIGNLHKAQENYADFLFSQIPESVETILDVGCGLGQTAKKLIDIGYRVDCVSPTPFLNEQVRSLLGNKSQIFECFYEEMETEKRYDLVLFAESFQYIALEKALKQTVKFLSNEGYLLICDVFKMEAKGKRMVGGGHKLKKFYQWIAPFPFELITEADITEKTAPNLDLLDDAVRNVVAPALDSGLSFLQSRYSLTVKFLRWKYKKRINKMYDKYFNDGRTADEFKKSKSYRLFLYRKVQPPANQEGRF